MTSRRTINPFVGQWRCESCQRTFSRHFTRCAYCPTGDAVEDDWLRLTHELLVHEGKAPWATEGRVQVTAQPPVDEALGNTKEKRKWRNSRTIRRSKP